MKYRKHRKMTWAGKIPLGKTEKTIVTRAGQADWDLTGWWGQSRGHWSMRHTVKRIEYKIPRVTANIYLGQILAKCFWRPCQTLRRWPERGCLHSKGSSVPSSWKWIGLNHRISDPIVMSCLLVSWLVRYELLWTISR